MSAFDKHLRYGRQGENVVALWLSKRGWFVTDMASIHNPRFRSPSMVRLDSLERKILMDLQTHRAGETRWVEVKSKTKDVFYNITQEHRQGIDLAHFEEYLNVQRVSGLPGDLAFLVATPTPIKLRIAPLDLLDQHKRTGMMGGVPHVFWPINIFDTYHIVDSDLVLMHPGVLPVNVKHVWEKPAPATDEKQEYFNFGGGDDRLRIV